MRNATVHIIEKTAGHVPVKKSTQKIGVLCGYRFPEGMAPTTRILAYCSGLAQADVNCEVIIFWPYESRFAAARRGCVGQTSYYYTSEKSSIRNTFLRRLHDRPLALLKTFIYIRAAHRKERFDYLFLSFDSIVLMAFFIPLLRLSGIKLAFIGDEYPYPIRLKLESQLPGLRKLCYRLLFKGISVKILMTQALVNFYNTISSCPAYILPSLVDSKRFSARSDKSEIEQTPPYLCYMGNLELQKDNVDNIIRAFSLISRRYPSFVLYLFGLPSARDQQILTTLISSLNLTERVFLKGRVNYDAVPQWLSNAKILVSSQPRTKRAEGGFPTKLGEYLMAQRPVIVTDVGEISHYISDGQNAYLVPPENPEMFAEKIAYVLDHYQEALETAKRGRQYALDNLNYTGAAEKLKFFLDTHLNSEKK